MKSQQGFTLIEVMVVVAIIAILAALAVPAYSDYVLRSKIPDATSNLSTKRVKLEQWFQDNRTYIGSGDCAAGTDSTTSAYFNFTCTSTATTYTATATGKVSLLGFSYTINQTGTKTSAIVAPAPSGWIASNAGCWITRKAGSC